MLLSSPQISVEETTNKIAKNTSSTTMQRDLLQQEFAFVTVDEMSASSTLRLPLLEPYDASLRQQQSNNLTTIPALYR
jgi:hypothetical protein